MARGAGLMLGRTRPGHDYQVMPHHRCSPPGCLPRDQSGEGDIFIRRAIECVSRCGKGSSDGAHDTKTPIFDRSRGRGRCPRAGGAVLARPARRRPDPGTLHRHGPDAENVAQQRGIAEAERRFRRPVEEPSGEGDRRTGSGRSTSRRYLTDGTTVAPNEGRGRNDAGEMACACSRCFRAGRTVTAATAAAQ